MPSLSKDFPTFLPSLASRAISSMNRYKDKAQSLVRKALLHGFFLACCKKETASTRASLFVTS
jgi:hypothetical protein